MVQDWSWDAPIQKIFNPKHMCQCWTLRQMVACLTFETVPRHVPCLDKWPDRLHVFQEGPPDYSALSGFRAEGLTILQHLGWMKPFGRRPTGAICMSCSSPNRCWQPTNDHQPTWKCTGPFWKSVFLLESKDSCAHPCVVGRRKGNPQMFYSAPTFASCISWRTSPEATVKQPPAAVHPSKRRWKIPGKYSFLRRKPRAKRYTVNKNGSCILIDTLSRLHWHPCSRSAANAKSEASRRAPMAAMAGKKEGPGGLLRSHHSAVTLGKTLACLLAFRLLVRCMIAPTGAFTSFLFSWTRSKQQFPTPAKHKQLTALHLEEPSSANAMARSNICTQTCCCSVGRSLIPC